MKHKLLWLLPGIIVLIADRLIKWITDGMHCVVFPGALAIHSARNTGAAMGILNGNPYIIVILSVALIGIAIWILRDMHISGMGTISLSLIAGGALGNMIDRIAYGYVMDMFEVLFMDFYIFNVADVAVVCGTALCAFSLIIRPRDWSKR